MDDALKRKMAQELSGIEQTTFWVEFLRAIEGHKKYHRQTLDGSEKEWAIARAQGGIAAIEKIKRLPSELTGRVNAPDDKE